MNIDVKLVSIVIPVYNEEDALPLCYDRLKSFMKTLPNYNFEIVFTDNHSTDATFNIIQKLARTDQSIRAFRFSKNVGYQRSILFGYLKARGHAVVQLDVDLQDPLPLIAEFIRKWDEGYAVVYGIRRERKEGIIISTLRKAYYRLIAAVSESNLPHDVGDFRLCDRKVIEALREYRLTFPYLRGLIADMGFKQIGIPYCRLERVIGESKFSLFGYCKFALDAVLTQSLLPLRLATISCVVIFLSGLVGATLYLLGYGAFGKNWPPGFATLIVTILIGFGFISLFIGILGEYLSRCLIIIEGRNEVIIECQVG